MPTQGSSRSLRELGSKFEATMVEARLLLQQLETTFCTEILPAISLCMSNSSHGLLEIAELTRRNADLLAQLEGKRASLTFATLTETTIVKPSEVTKTQLTKVPNLEQNKGCLKLAKLAKGVRPALVDVTNKQAISNSEGQGWRQTRSATPREDFLDTPREIILSKLVAPDLEQCFPCPSFGVNLVTRIASFTGEQGLSVGFRSTRKPIQAMENQNNKPASMKTPGFKFNEPVRCKRDREDLIAMDCKQCRKFYDVVEVGDARALDKSRCEHLQAISRHRFQNLPPDTPLGFWDLGFPDSV